MKIDLSATPVEWAGSGGHAARSAGGFITLVSYDGRGLLDIIDEHQYSAELIERIVAGIEELTPAAFGMVFTSSGVPHLLAWGAVETLVESDEARLALTAAPNRLLVQPVPMDDDTVVTMSLGESVPMPRVIDLTSGHHDASSVTIGAARSATAETPDPTVPAFAAAAPVTVADPAAPLRPAQLPTTSPPTAAEIPFGRAVADAETTSLAPRDSPASPSTPPPEPAWYDDAAPTAPIVIALTERDEIPVEADSPAPAQMADAPVIGPVILLGASCTYGHHNHPAAAWCAMCGTSLESDHARVLVNAARPALGLLVLDDGSTFSLDRNVIIGRDAGTADAVTAGQAFPLTLDDATTAMSRHHAVIQLEGWDVSVADLTSSNGTYIKRDPLAPAWTRVEPGAPVTLKTGDRLKLGGRLIRIELHFD